MLDESVSVAFPLECNIVLFMYRVYIKYCVFSCCNFSLSSISKVSNSTYKGRGAVLYFLVS